jgi:branched-chain amino acid transport system ATP-binding protein
MDRGEVRFTGERDELAARSDLVRAVFLRAGDGAPRARAAGDGQTAGDGGRAARLRVEGVVVRFGGVIAVNGLDLDAGAGQILGLIGANGAGKTTLFDACSGFVRPDAGRVLLEGEDVTGMSPWDRAELGLGRSAQDARLFPSMTVVEALATALERHVEVREPIACTLRVGATIESEQAVAARVDELLDRMGLAPYRDLFVSELSTGMRRILDLACALAHEPEVLLLDEPSTGLAQRETEVLGELLVRLRDDTGATLVVVEHDVPLVSQVADELACMHLGRVIARGAPAKVLEDPAVVAAYLGTDEAAIARSGPAGKRRAARTRHA